MSGFRAGKRATHLISEGVYGSGDYDFMLTVIDGQVSGGGGVDKFRLKIWDTATGDVIYDNQMGAEDTDDPTMPLGGGSIALH